MDSEVKLLRDALKKCRRVADNMASYLSTTTNGQYDQSEYVAAMEEVHLALQATEQEEYTDELTGVRLTIKHDNAEHPLIILDCGANNTLTVEQINAALGRLRQRAGLTESDLPSPYTMK